MLSSAVDFGVGGVHAASSGAAVSIHRLGSAGQLVGVHLAHGSARAPEPARDAFKSSSGQVCALDGMMRRLLGLAELRCFEQA